MLLEREAGDRALAESLAEPLAECLVCLESVKVADSFTSDCVSSHRFCFACARRHVRVALAERKVPSCVLCAHAMTQVEVRQLFGRETAECPELADFLACDIRNVMAASPLV